MSAIRFLICRHAATAAASSAAMMLGQGRVGVGRSMPSVAKSIMKGLIPPRDPLPARLFSDQATSWLISTVKKEIDFETRGPDEPNSEILARGTPAGWTLVENEVPGDTLMVLKKQVEDAQLEIEWMVNDQPSTTEPEVNEEDEEDEEMTGSALVNFTMKVIKADQQLVVELLTPGGSAHIQHVTLAPKGGFPGDSDSMYHGPVFDELDEELQAGLTDYLRDVGLTPDVIDFVFAKVYSKERTEYVAWLQRLEKFLEQ